jgi:hypothetical protein
MKHIYFFFILLIAAFCVHVVVYSQDNKEEKMPLKYLDMGVGYSQFRMLDKQASPLIYKTQLITVLVGYTKESNRGIMSVNLHVGNGFTGLKRFPEREIIYTGPDNDGVLKEEKYVFKHNYFFQDELNFSYVWKLDHLSITNIRCYAGTQLKQFFYISFPAVPILVQSELSINPAIQLNYRVKNMDCRSLLFLYVAGIITCLPYSNDPTDGKHNYFISTVLMGSEFMTIKDFQRINFQQSFVYPLSGKWSGGINYNFYWYGCHKNKSTKAYDNAITITFIRKIHSHEN